MRALTISLLINSYAFLLDILGSKHVVDGFVFAGLIDLFTSVLVKTDEP